MALPFLLLGALEPIGQHLGRPGLLDLVRSSPCSREYAKKKAIDAINFELPCG
jgi:hypothetical protein